MFVHVLSRLAFLRFSRKKKKRNDCYPGYFINGAFIVRSEPVSVIDWQFSFSITCYYRLLIFVQSQQRQ